MLWYRAATYLFLRRANVIEMKYTKSWTIFVINSVWTQNRCVTSFNYSRMDRTINSELTESYIRPYKSTSAEKRNKLFKKDASPKDCRTRSNFAEILRNRTRGWFAPKHGAALHLRRRKDRHELFVWGEQFHLWTKSDYTFMRPRPICIAVAIRRVTERNYSLLLPAAPDFGDCSLFLF